jgi:hypothetical protein
MYKKPSKTVKNHPRDKQEVKIKSSSKKGMQVFFLKMRVNPKKTAFLLAEIVRMLYKLP